MFGYLKVFVLVSLISVVIIAVMIGFYLRSMNINDLMRLSENTNKLTAASYINSVWEQHPYPTITLRSKSTASTQEQKKAFLENTRQFLTNIDARHYNIYDRIGQPIYVHQGDATNIRLVVQSINDLKTQKKDTLSVLSKEAIEGGDKQVFLKTFMPILSPDKKQYYVELNNDITREYNQIILQQWVASGSIILVFLFLMWILIQTSKRAEQIIARQHESNMELAKKAAVAESENEQKSMFLANISHELRTPLNAIIGFSDIMKTQAALKEEPGEFDNYIHDIHNAGVHLLSLINDILDFSKAEAGKLEMDVVEVNFNKMLKNCLRLVSTRAEEAKVMLTDASPKDPLILYTDNKKLKQILLNLLSNAVKFTPEGGQVRVSAWRNVQNDTIGFEVQDNGIGMAPKDISRAMSPFGQVDNALSRKYDGTGLGLPLTKKFVEIMGGEFKIESVEGKGTIITINLPVEYKGLNAMKKQS